MSKFSVAGSLLREGAFGGGSHLGGLAGPLRVARETECGVSCGAPKILIIENIPMSRKWLTDKLAMTS